MLSSVKQAIDSLPEKDFSEFYQEYIISTQDRIINHDLDLASRVFHNVEDVTYLIQGLNTLTEELKK